MYLLKKVFQFREHTNPSAEMPFLDHLEDLRIMFTRVIVTLLITTAACFVFRTQLMDIIRAPVEEVWVSTESEALADLPEEISLEDWERAKNAVNVTLGHNEEQRAHHYKFAGRGIDEFAFHADAAYWYRSALAIEDEKARPEYLKTVPGLSDRMRKQCLALLEGGPNASLDAHGKLVLMQSLKPTEGFILSLKLALYAGIVLAFPLLLLFILQFVLPGLHQQERKVLWPALAVAFFLFLSGVLFAYFGVLPRVLRFFHDYSLNMAIANEWRIGYYISFATQFTLIFGLAFELPVVVMALVKLGILEFEMMRRTRAYAILAIFVIAAVITPTPDALTLSLLAVPMIILYEICIWLAYFMGKKDRERAAQEEKERMERLLAHEEETEEFGEDQDHEDHEDHEDHDDHEESEGYEEPEHDEYHHESDDDHPIGDDHPTGQDEDPDQDREDGEKDR